MSKLNNVLLEGTITRTSELKKINNMSLAQFSIKAHQGGKDDAKSSFYINISAWGDLAESASASGKLKEGTDIVVFGKLKHQMYQDKTSGLKKENHFVLASDIKFIGGENNAAKENKVKVGSEEYVEDLPF